MATTAIGNDRKQGSAMERYPDAVFMRDDTKFYFGNDGDTSMWFDGTTLRFAGDDIEISDTQQLTFGDGNDATITWNGSTLALGGTWYLSGVDIRVSDTQKLTFGNADDVTINWNTSILKIAGGDIELSDTQKLCFGNGSDIQMYYKPTTNSDTLILTGLATSSPNFAGGLFVSDAGGTTLRISS